MDYKAAKQELRELREELRDLRISTGTASGFDLRWKELSLSLGSSPVKWWSGRERYIDDIAHDRYITGKLVNCTPGSYCLSINLLSGSTPPQPTFPAS